MRTIAAITALLTITACGAPIAVAADIIPVIDFDRGAMTAQHGLVFSVGDRPDKVNDRLHAAGEPRRACWQINVADDAPSEGACGFIPLFDNRSGNRPRNLLDASTAQFVHLSLIGDLGKRSLKIDVVPGIVTAAERWGATAGVLSGIDINDSEWKDTKVSLDLEGLDKTQLGSIRLTLSGEGPAWVAVSDVWFSAGADTARPNAYAAEVPAGHPLRRATWVWYTREIIADSAQSAELLRFCTAHQITDIFLQIPYQYEDGVVTLEMPDALRAFNVAAHRVGITVHALDGRPEFILERNHDRMFRFVEAIAKFNAAGDADGRYSAIHLDNEPYVMEGWRNDAERKTIIHDYVKLNRELSRRIHDANMRFGVDIPFWWDDIDSDGNPKFTAPAPSGGQMPLIDAVFDCMDNVGIMSYRERATGPNGVIGCCATEFDLGVRKNVGVFASVELGTGPNVEPGITFGVFPMQYFNAQLETLTRALAYTEGCAGIAIHYYRVYLALETQS